ncbi:MAG TPA: tRNA 4-thiouridine(8) synthase ThiI [Nitrospirae bacterium]|nr:tRNA 4-thiouridine(8) synthase ThiI [Nitrospirota bacterium]
MSKALVLFSGGLDSCLAILILLKQGIKVTAIRFITSFGCGSIDDISSFADRCGFTLIERDIRAEFLRIVKKPTFGYGKNMNPCIDCKILMLREAAKMMTHFGADFIATGEVLGQRPMSQQRHIFNLMEKQTALKGYILRPLSARLLNPTIPEQKGLIDRERLYGITGRGRKAQIALAEEFGLKKYPAPAGGCLLTEPNFAYRLRELLNYNSNPSIKELQSLRFGRHFRLPSGVKVIVGRNREDNEKLLSLKLDAIVMEPSDTEGPIVLLLGENIGEQDILDSASLCARYSDSHGKDVLVKIQKPTNDVTLLTMRGKGLDNYMIKKN